VKKVGAVGAGALAGGALGGPVGAALGGYAGHRLTRKEEVESLDEISTKLLTRAAHSASDPDNEYLDVKDHDPQKFADYAKKTKSAKDAKRVQAAADGEGHWPGGKKIRSYMNKKP
jgi:hypothetical protein